ncbi:MAG: tetratricopeptide repeat protein [Alphaproteobacteria bacterium]|nr:tetratricopeptide repeat protein [Alphaproteobacteria bacterium]
MKKSRYMMAALPMLIPLCLSGAALAQESGEFTPMPSLAVPPASTGTVVLPPEQGDRMALEIAQRLLAERKFDEAYEILLILARRRPDERDLQILIAQTEVALGQPKAAISRLEALRDKHPDWPRPRVELALAHAAAGNIRTAKAILVAELGKNPPEHVRQNIESAIRSLEDKQTFVGRFDVGVAPDSNITGGTYNDTVNFFGLPFTLNDDAKQQEGVRGTISAGGTMRTPWDQNTRIELGIDAVHSEPLGSKGTPSSNVRATLAARVRMPKGSMRTGLAVQPFYVDNKLQRIEQSVFAEGGRLIAGPLTLTGSVTLSDGDVAHDILRDYQQWETSFGPSIGLGKSTNLQLQGVFGDRNAEDDLYSFLRRGLSMNLSTRPANGWRATLGGSLTRDVYRDYSVFFGARQEDLTASANMEVVWAGLVFMGLSPSFNLGYSETRSTINLYDRRSVNFGLGFALPY